MATGKLTLILSTIVIAWFRLVSCEDQGLPLKLNDRSSLPDLLTVLKCGFDAEPMTCARKNAGRMLDVLENELGDEMKSWGEAADAEVVSSGRQLVDSEEMPSEAAQKLQMALSELVNILQKSAFKSMARKKEESSGGGGGVSSITITAGGGEDKKKKKKKKKDKPANIHIHQDQQKAEEDKGVLAEYPPENTDGTMIQGLWVDRDLEGPAKTRIKREQDIDDDDDDDDEVRDVEDGRGKKKKKKKAILKLLLLGAVLKAKISLLLQLLSAHLQVKFFAIALAGLALNIARFWLDLKKGHQPQKVIYYEHAQHQHHYEHDDDHGWGGWSRSLDIGPVKTKEEEIYNEPIESEVEHGGYDENPYSGWTAPARSLNARNIRRRR